MASAASFNDAAIYDVFDRIIGFAEATGRFDSVNQHEPKNAPGNGVVAALWIQNLKPTKSGQSETSVILNLNLRLYTNFRAEPFDIIDPNIMAASTDIMAQLSGDFEMGGSDNVRFIDLLGAYGSGLTLNAGYVEIDRSIYRVMTITIPIVINDAFTQEP